MEASSTISTLEEALTYAPSCSIGIGSTVELDRTGRSEVWTIVDGRSDPDHGVIAADTPLALALVGAELGDRVIYTAAGRKWLVRVTRIVDADQRTANGERT